MNIIRNKKGSALLVALIIISVLISGSLFLSSVIFKDTRLTADLIASNKAFYAAESGVEMSLYGLNSNLPGWQSTKDGYSKIASVGDSVVEYFVNNRCDSFPCFEGVENVFNIPKNQLYFELDWNETIQIPMFYYDPETAEVKDVEDFSVQFYSNVRRDDLPFQANQNVNSFDVLRWKIFGLKDVGPTTLSESISDYTAVSLANFNGQEFHTDASIPSWFGTKECDELNPESGINCKPYDFGNQADFVYDENGQAQVVGSCGNTQVREYYDYQVIDGDKILNEENIFACYPIKSFLEGHKLNYLSLTNLTNRNLFKRAGSEGGGLTSAEIEEKLKLYVRVDFGDDLAEREYALIESNGYFASSQNRISVQIKQGEVMPVFNFALFSTGGSRD